MQGVDSPTGHRSDGIFLNNIAKYGCTSVVTATNLNYNWFGNTYENYNMVPVENNKLKNWLFLNATHERLMIAGEEMKISRRKMKEFSLRYRECMA